VLAWWLWNPAFNQLSDDAKVTYALTGPLLLLAALFCVVIGYALRRMYKAEGDIRIVTKAHVIDLIEGYEERQDASGER